MFRGRLPSHPDEVFDPPTDLTRRASRAGRFVALGQVFGALMGLGSMAVLNRLLSPDDFGLVAMVTVVTAFTANFADAGFTSTVILHERLTHRQVSNLFWVNVSLGLVLAALVAVLSPLLSEFYGRPEVGPICIGCACSFVPISLGVQHGAILRRRLEFGRLTIAAQASVLVGIVAAVLVAEMGGRYWALVVQLNAMLLSRSVLYWVFAGWCPSLPSRYQGTRALVSFGGIATADEIVRYFGRNLDGMIVGRVLGAPALGLAWRASALFGQVSTQLAGPFGSVALPALSRVQFQPERFVSAYRLGLSMVASVALPSVSFMFVYAKPLIRLFLGEQWLDCLPIYRWMLGDVLALSIGGSAVGWLFVYGQRLRSQLKLTTVSAALRVACALAFIQFGLVVFVAVMSAVSLAILFVGFAYGSRGSPVRMSDLAEALGIPVVASVFAGFVSFLALLALPESLPAVALAGSGGLVFTAAYVVVWIASERGRTAGRAILATIVAGARSR